MFQDLAQTMFSSVASEIKGLHGNYFFQYLVTAIFLDIYYRGLYNITQTYFFD